MVIQSYQVILNTSSHKSFCSCASQSLLYLTITVVPSADMKSTMNPSCLILMILYFWGNVQFCGFWWVLSTSWLKDQSR